ncbi:50S ribosomal protein L29 [Candidatus Micrarchaeota archaeon]|nr:50S ribosomal protein L29 [Candidatus Micrarchaeota archaeon]
MAIAKINDLRALAPDELSKRLETYEREMLEAGDNPKKPRNLRKAIARIKTILNEEKNAPKKSEAHKKQEAKPEKKKVK